MSEKLELDLALNDQVSATAKKAADALRKVEEQAQKAQRTLGDKQMSRFGDIFAKVGMKAEGAAIKQQKAFAGSWDKIGLAAQRAADKASKAHEHSKHGWLGEGMEEANNNLLKKFAAFELFKGFAEGAMKAVEIVAEGVKEAFKAGAEQEKLALSYRLMFGKAGGKEKMEDQERFAKNTQYTGSQIGRMMIPLYSSGMNDKAARQAVGTAADLEARTGRPITEFIDMLARINAKGGITEKMLIGLNLNSKEFYTALGKTAHMTAEEAKKKAAAGKIDPQAIENTLTAMVNKSQGGEAGTGGKMLSETMAGRWKQLTDLPERYLEKMQESPSWQKLSDRIGEVLKGLDPESERGKKIMGSLFDTFNKIADVIESALQPANLDKFVSMVDEALKTVKATIDLISGETLSKKVFGGDAGDKAIAAIEFKKKELSMSSGLTAQERKAKESEISGMEGRLTPSEKSDYQTRAPGVSKGGKAPLQLVVTNHNKIDVHPAKDDVNHTGQKIAEATANATDRHVERMRQEAGRL